MANIEIWGFPPLNQRTTQGWGTQAFVNTSCEYALVDARGMGAVPGPALPGVAVCFGRRWLRLIPRQYTRRRRPFRQTHGLRAGEPFFRLVGNLEQQGFKLRSRALQDVR